MLPDPDDRPVRGKQRRGLRGLTVGIAVSALVIFLGLIGYTYIHGVGDRTDGPVPLIKADTRPMKTAPDKPGGMDVPHQDKEIYNRMGRDSAAPPPPRVERLLPPPETPIDRPRPATAPPPLEPDIPAAPMVTPPPGAVEVAQPPEPAPAPAPAPAPPRPAASAPAPQPPQAAPPPQTATARPPAPPAPAAATAGRYRVQLAALRTPEDAGREWDRLRRAHPDLLGSLTLNVVRADLGGRGTFYRIQAGPIGDDNAAKELCRRLAEKKVGCLVVRP